MKTEQLIEALKASVGSYFWEKSFSKFKEMGEYIICFNAARFFRVSDHSSIYMMDTGTPLTIEECKAILVVYAAAWERAHPEGALHQSLKHDSLKYGGVAFFLTLPYPNEEDQRIMLDYGPYEFRGESISMFDTFEEAEKTGRQTIHDHLKAQLKP